MINPTAKGNLRKKRFTQLTDPEGGPVIVGEEEGWQEMKRSPLDPQQQG